MFLSRLKVVEKNIRIPGLVACHKISKCTISSQGPQDFPRSEYDAVIIGAGHNGLTAAAYLQKSGLKVCVLERRHVIGGAAVTEEIVPGFKFSRCSYVLSLLRPVIYKDLDLKKHGLKIYLRNPGSYTPLKESYWQENKPKSLTLWMDSVKTRNEIAKFSKRDAEVYPLYERRLERIINCCNHLFDTEAPKFSENLTGWTEAFVKLKPLLKSGYNLGRDVLPFLYLMSSSVGKILCQQFETESLISTLASDGVIGSNSGPFSPGTGYLLLHHVMGELENVTGAWGYVEGGMGAVSDAIANSARSFGTEIFVNKTVKAINVKDQKVNGVILSDGTEIKAKIVLSNATPKITYIDLLPKGILNEKVYKGLSAIDYTSPVTKINVALSCIPSFTANPNSSPGVPEPHHQATIHMNCENIGLLEESYKQGQTGLLPTKPMIEMVIPSSLDPTLAPKGGHVALLFTQFTPYNLTGGWSEENKTRYAEIVFSNIEDYAPGFKKSIVGYEVLSPPDLENIFGLTGGNIFHGSLSLDQLYSFRPHPSIPGPKTPIDGLFICGSGSHPGGGVTGSPGRLAALSALNRIKKG